MAEEKPVESVDESEMPEDTPGYKVAAKKDLRDIVSADAEDESLRRYKEQLLGAAAAGEGAASDDPRQVIIDEMRIIVAGKDDIVVPLATEDNIRTASEAAYALQEGSEYRLRFRFRVQRDIVMGLKLLLLVYKMGIRVDKSTDVIGSFAPRAEPHEVTLRPQIAPSGMMSRGSYKVVAKFVDDDKQTHLSFSYTMAIKK